MNNMAAEKISATGRITVEYPQKGLTRFLSQRLSFLGPAVPVMVFCLCGLVLFSLFRTALFLEYFDRVWKVENCLFIFPIGVQVDIIMLSYLMMLPLTLLLLLPGTVTRKIKWVLSFYFALATGLIVFMECATFPFMAEFDTRPDRLFIEHIVQVREVFGMVWKGYTATVIIALSAMSLTAGVVFFFSQRLLRVDMRCSYFRRTALFLVISLLLFMGARSGFRSRPANIVDLTFSKSHLVNQIALNTVYSLSYDYFSQRKAEKGMGRSYGKMEPLEIISRIQKTALISKEECTNPEIPLLHYQQSSFSFERTLNLVIIMEESLGAQYVGCLGGLPLTPYIDKLSQEGLLFTNFYCTGTRTARGIEAILSGFLPTPGKSVVKLGLSRRNFFTIAELLRRRGYITEFIYGGNSHFDNMSTFFLGNGIQIIYDEKDFENPVFRGNWGVSDEDLFSKANEVFTSHGAMPFFALILTTSNHDPFEFPDGRIELYEQPKMTRHNAMKYADFAVGKFFEMAKSEPYYENTVFLVIADHSTRLSGQDLTPIHKFRVPALIIGPNVMEGIYEKIASQVDMMPTLLDLIGMSAAHPNPGRNLLTIPDSTPGRAVIQYGKTHAYMVGNLVIIQRPEMEPLQFTYKDGRLLRSELDTELARDALAHALLPSYLYYNFLHRLPEEKP